MAKSIRHFMTICTGTVTFATVFVHFCEVRQCINKYTLGGVAFLIKLYKTRRDCKVAADECRANMTCGKWKQSYACFAVMVLDQIKDAAGMSSPKTQLPYTLEQRGNSTLRALRTLSRWRGEEVLSICVDT